MPNRFVSPVIAEQDKKGRTLPYSYFLFFDNGTLTPKLVFSDANLTIPLTQPVTADGGGEFPDIFLALTAYRVQYYDRNGVLQWDRDNVVGIEAGTGEGGVVKLAVPRVILTAGQTTVPVSTSYTVGNNSLSVYRNGILQRVVIDYTETNQNEIELVDPGLAGETLDMFVLQNLSIGAAAATVSTTTVATAGQTAFTVPTYVQGQNNIAVYQNGVRQAPKDFTETSTTSITLAVPAIAGDFMYFVVNEVTAIAGTIPASNVIYNTSNAQIKLDSVDVTTTDILGINFTGIQQIITSGYSNVGDGGGAKWTPTGNTNVGLAGTTDFANGNLYDSAGNEFKINQSPLNVKAFGAVNSSVSDNASSFIAAIAFANDVLIPAGSYLIEQEIVVPAAKTIRGEGSVNEKNKAATLIHGGTGHLFTTDETINDFAGITFQNFRVVGGVAGKYAVQSHYPYTFIFGVYVENTSGTYAGEAFRIHNDGGQPGMGGFSSKIANCKSVLDISPTPIGGKTHCQLDINGGNVAVEKCDFLNGEVGIEIVRGENIVISECNINRMNDVTSTSGNIQKASIILGTDISTIEVESPTIRDNYIEGHSRAILVFNASNVTIEGNFIDDTQSFDPSFPGGSDGEINITDKTDGVTIKSNHIKIAYNTKALVKSNFLATLNGWTSEGNTYIIDRGAQSYLGTAFDGDEPRLRANDRYQLTQSSTTTNTIYNVIADELTWNSIPTTQPILNFTQDFNPIGDSTPTKIGDIQNGEIWDIFVTQFDDTIRFQYSVCHVLLNGAGSTVQDVFSGSAVSVTVVGNEIFLTQTTGFGRRMLVSATRRF